MAKMLKSNQLARNVMTVYFMEELEKAGKTYWDFLEYCDGLQIPMVVSPVHDKDEYTAEDVRGWVDRHIDPDHYSFISSDIEKVREVAPKVGDKKKAHVHFALKLDGRRNAEYFSSLFDDFIPIPKTRWQVVISWDSAIRYYAHMDTPEKYRYSELDIQGFGGVDLSMLVKVDKQSRIRTLMFVKKEIYKNNFKYFHELDNWCYKTGDAEVINCVTGRSSYFVGLFNSIRQKDADKKLAKKEKEGNAGK